MVKKLMLAVLLFIQLFVIWALSGTAFATPEIINGHCWPLDVAVPESNYTSHFVRNDIYFDKITGKLHTTAKVNKKDTWDQQVKWVYHGGTDLKASYVPVYAVCDGTIIAA